jgi:ketosteroid isomerase-like protein
MPSSVEIFVSAWRAFAENRAEDLSALVHPDVEWHSAPLGEVFRGPDAVERWWTAISREYKSLTVVLESASEVDDDCVIAFGRATGFSHGGEQSCDGDLAWVTEHADGRIVRGRVFRDHEAARRYVASRGAEAA